MNTKSEKEILITGTDGFIGSHLTEALVVPPEEASRQIYIPLNTLRVNGELAVRSPEPIC